MSSDDIEWTYRHITEAIVANNAGDDDPRIGHLVEAIRHLAIQVRTLRAQVAELGGEARRE